MRLRTTPGGLIGEESRTVADGPGYPPATTATARRRCGTSRHVKENVAAYKYPRHLWLVDELPKGPTGKILKREIVAACGGAVMSGPTNGGSSRGPRAASRAALDVLLTDAAIEPRTVGRLVQPVTAARLAGGLARHPRRVARRVGGLGAELTRIAVGGSEVAPPKGDRRFSDRAWRESWLFHRLMQAYLALEDAAEGLSTTPGWTGATSCAPGSWSRTCSTRSRRRTSASPTPRCSRRRSTAAAPTSSRAAAGSSAMPPTAGCPRWSTRAGSRSAATSRSARARSCCVRRCSS